MKPKKVMTLLLISIILLNLTLFINHDLKQKKYEQLRKLYIAEQKIMYTKRNIKAMEEYITFTNDVLNEYDYLMERD